MKSSNIKILTEEVEQITEKMLKPYLSNKVLLVIENKEYYGTLKTFRSKYAVCDEDTVIKSFTLEDVQKISGKNQKTNLFESVIKCGDKKYCVKSKKGKNLGGPYDSMAKAKDRLQQVEYFKQLKENNLILREKLKNKFFKLDEEIVNKDNKGKLTGSRQASRDSIEKKLKNVKVVKGPPGRMDTPTEARYRLATYLELKKGK